tara:strand:+ start:5892 stop:6131 length:240 start_codon:yes stop_codon:yes gene_type:complete
MQNIEKKLENIFEVVFDLKKNKIKKSNFSNTKKWDSINHLNLILALESNFKIKISPEISIKLLSYSNVFNFLKKNINKK